MQNYEIISLVGEGSFGRVYKARQILTNEIVAYKTIVKTGRAEKELKGLRQECEIQRHLNHPNIVRMVDSFETENQIVVVTEFVERQLYNILGTEGKLTEDEVCKISCDLVSALFYLHRHRILHRDLKPQNVLIDNNGVAKLCDFGFARNMGTKTHVLTSIKGTPLYMAPELLEERPYDYNADLWSLGCIIYELLVGTPPFNTTNLLQLVRLLQEKTIYYPAFISPECKNFLEGLLHKDSDKRMPWSVIIKHPFLKNGVIADNDDACSLKNPFTTDMSASQMIAKQYQKQNLSRKNELHYAQYYSQYINPYYNLRVQPEFYVPPTTVNTEIKEPIICGNNNPNLIKASSCPSKSCNDTKVDCILHSSLKSMVKSFDSSNEKKVYNSVASNKSDGVDKNVGVDGKSTKNVFALHSWHSAVSARPIENDEWLAFLQRNMEEVMTGQLDCLRNHNLVSVVVSPLRNTNASCKVLEYVANLLSLPFVVDGPVEKDLDNIKQVYLEVKVVPNLLFATKTVAKKKGENEASGGVSTGSDMKLRQVSELSSAELHTLESIFLLICHLVHCGNDFLVQFCNAAAVLNIVTLLQGFLLLGGRKVRVVTDMLAVLNLVLREAPENVDVVQQIVFGTGRPSDKNVIEEGRLLCHLSGVVRTRTCELISLLTSCGEKSITSVWTSRLQQDLHLLLTDSITSVKIAAEEAVDMLKCLTLNK